MRLRELTLVDGLPGVALTGDREEIENLAELIREEVVVVVLPADKALDSAGMRELVRRLGAGVLEQALRKHGEAGGSPAGPSPASPPSGDVVITNEQYDAAPGYYSGLASTERRVIVRDHDGRTRMVLGGSLNVPTAPNPDHVAQALAAMLSDQVEQLAGGVVAQVRALLSDRRCRECGCIERTGQPCWWVEEDLCSACCDRDDAGISAADAIQQVIDETGRPASADQQREAIRQAIHYLEMSWTLTEDARAECLACGGTSKERCCAECDAVVEVRMTSEGVECSGCHRTDTLAPATGPIHLKGCRLQLAIAGIDWMRSNQESLERYCVKEGHRAIATDHMLSMANQWIARLLKQREALKAAVRRVALREVLTKALVNHTRARAFLDAADRIRDRANNRRRLADGRNLVHEVAVCPCCQSEEVRFHVRCLSCKSDEVHDRWVARQAPDAQHELAGELEVEADELCQLAAQQRASQGALEIARERRRQIEEEGYTAERDDGYTESELEVAAACYAVVGTGTKVYCCDGTDAWPWGPDADNRAAMSRRRRLVIAGALIAAAIDRIDRATVKYSGEVSD